MFKSLIPAAAARCCCALRSACRRRPPSALDCSQAADPKACAERERLREERAQRRATCTRTRPRSLQDPPRGRAARVHADGNVPRGARPGALRGERAARTPSAATRCSRPARASRARSCSSACATNTRSSARRRSSLRGVRAEPSRGAALLHSAVPHEHACSRLAPAAGFALPAAAPRTLPQKVAAVEGVTEYRLANGLRVLLVPDPSADTVTVHITYLVGSRHEGYGEKGMAHLLEHMLFKGSKRHPDVKEELHAPRRALERHHLQRPHQLLRDAVRHRATTWTGRSAWKPTAW